MGDKIRLLLVEDEQTLAGIIADTLSEKGFEVTVAYDGEAGLRAFRGSRGRRFGGCRGFGLGRAQLGGAGPREGRLLGYALGGLGQDRSQGWLLSLAVRPEARGFGLAEQMMLQVEQGLLKLEVERVRLTVDPANPAQRLYFRLGYQQLAEERGYFGPGEDRLLLEKALT